MCSNLILTPFDRIVKGFFFVLLPRQRRLLPLNLQIDENYDGEKIAIFPAVEPLLPLSRGWKVGGGCTPLKSWYTVYTVTGSPPAWIEMSIKTPKQKAPTLAGEGLCFMRAYRRAWCCSCACPCGSGACCSGSCSWSTPPLRSHSLLASGISPARPSRPARLCFRPLWLAAAAARPVPAPFRAVPYTRPPRAPVCPKCTAL